MGLAGTGNGLLLSLAAREGFDAIITVDRGIEQHFCAALSRPRSALKSAQRSAIFGARLTGVWKRCVDGIEVLCDD